MYRSDNGTVSHVEYKINSVKDAFWRPCQNCINCKIRRATDKAIRMVHESKFHDQNCFLTLTYDDQKLPPGGSLFYSDVKHFIGRLRSKLKYPNISYYRVGEYGEKFSRPHYHMILFGYNFTDLSVIYQNKQNTLQKSAVKSDRVYYKSSFATDLWSHGYVDIGSVDFKTCLYTAKYVTKKLYGSQTSLYEHRLPERASSSKKNPIGKSWIEKYYSDVYPHDYVVLDGKKYQPPRYYDEWLQKNKPSLYSLVKQRRENFPHDHPDWYDLNAKHIIRIQKQSKFLRDGCAPNLTNDEYQLERKRSILENLRKGLSHET